MSVATPSARAMAGGLVPVGTDCGTDPVLVDVVARRWSHPALGDRPVIRLCSAALVEVEDAEMEAWGFEGGADQGPVARETRRAVGFPGAVFLQDPERGRIALEYAKEMKKLLRHAVARPGHIEKEIVAVAVRLGRAVPHFLPSYHEEAARGFAATGNVRIASLFFGRAREAERVHALSIDHEHLRDTFVEFALSGAVSAKSLKGYVNDLLATDDAEAAFEHFFHVCVRRTNGGVPPFAGIAQELRKLGKAAGLKPAEVDRRLLESVLGAPAMTRAAASVWKSLGKSLAKLVKTSPERQAQLRALYPAPEQATDDFYQWWLETLDAAGALRVLVEPASEDSPVGDTARWIAWWCRQFKSYWSANGPPATTRDLVQRAASRLKADAEPVAFTHGWRGNVWEFECLEAALGLRLPVVDPTEDASISLRGWATSPDYCDPSHVLADTRFAPLLVSEAGDRFDDTDLARAAQVRPALKEARRRWLDGRVEALNTVGLPELCEILDQLRSRVSPAVLAEYPGVLDALERVSVVPAFTRTLRFGVYDELGWPALERVVKKLGGKHVKLHGAAPNLVLTNGVQAIALTPEGEAPAHDIVAGSGFKLDRLRYVQGQYLVMLVKNWTERLAYWSGSPRETFTLEHQFAELNVASVLLPDGALVEGTCVLRAGERALPDPDSTLHDGVTFWARDWRRSDHGYFEFDPTTGERGRVSVPSQFEDALPPGRRCLAGSALVPRSHRAGDTDLIGYLRHGSIDEGRWTTGTDIRLPRGPGGSLPSRSGLGAVVFPGVADLLCAAGNYLVLEGAAERLAVWPEHVNYRKAGWANGSSFIVPPALAHFLAPRDPDGSAWLRGISQAEAGALVAACVDEDAKVKPKLTRPVKDENLRAGIVGVGRIAAGAARTLATHCETARSSATVVGIPILLESVPWTRLLGDIVPQELGIEKLPVGVQCLDQLADSLGTELPQPSRAAVTCFWIAAHWRALVLRAVQPWNGPEVRLQLAAILEALAAMALLDGKHTVRWAVCETNKAGLGKFEDNSLYASERKQGRFLLAVNRKGWNRDEYTVEMLEVRERGEFDAYGFTPERSYTLRAGADAASNLRTAAKLLRENGAVPWDPAIAAEIAQDTGLTELEAALVWGSLPGINDRTTFPWPDVQDTFGFKTREAGMALAWLTDGVPNRPARVLAAAVPGEIAALWKPLEPCGPERLSPAHRLAAAWCKTYGLRPRIDLGLAVRLDDEVCSYLPRAVDLLAAFSAGPAHDAPSRIWTDGEPVYGGSHSIVAALLWIAAYTPIGDRSRRGLTTQLKATRRWLQGHDTPWLLTSIAYTTQRELLRSSLDLVVPRGGDGDEWMRDEGRVVVEAKEGYGGEGSTLQLSYRPKRIRSREDLLYVERIWNALEERAGRPRTLTFFRLLSSRKLAEALRPDRERGLPEGTWEIDPRKGAPSVVEQLAGSQEISTDAAAYYLQLLALPYPTDKNVRTWNGWTAKAQAAAAAPLLERGLIVEAKRARAGRKWFLPGPWLPLSEQKPLERWKVGLYDLDQPTDEKKLITPLGGPIVPTEPLVDLYTRAALAVVQGKGPRYEELT